MSNPIKLSWCTIGLWYLAFPVTLFFFFWLRTPYNIVFTAITIGVGLKYSIESINQKTQLRVNFRYLLLTLCISLFFAILSGAGGFFWQKPDWTKHNVVLNDLIMYRWPVNYGTSVFADNTSLVYYVAYYLPAAIIGKLFGWRAGELGLFLQSLVGLFIFAQLMGENLRFSSKRYFGFFLLSGADILGLILLQSWPIATPHIEQYATSLQFSSVMTQLMWVPQHALAGWVGAMLAYNDYTDGRILKTLPLYVAITFLWSPFVSLGIGIIFLPFVISTKLKRYFNIYALSGTLILGMILLYYQSQIHVSKDIVKIYLISNIHVINNFGMMIAFLIFDLYIFALVLTIVRHKVHTREKKLITWAFFALVLIAQIMYGAANDFVMRVSIPALTLIFVFVLRYIHHIFQEKSFISVIVFGIIFCGVCTPLVELYRGFQKGDSATNERPIYSMVNAHLRYKVLHQQYLGLTTKAFGRYFGNYVLDKIQEK